MCFVDAEGALVLIDEAEMLLERRTKGDIVRNAMVCVMLRLLEYYRGEKNGLPAVVPPRANSNCYVVV